MIWGYGSLHLRDDIHDCSLVMISVCIFLVSWVLPHEIEYLVGLKRISLSLCLSFCRWTDRSGSFPQCCSWISVVPPTPLMTNSNCADVGEVISLIAYFEVREGNKMRSSQFSPCLSKTYLSQFCRLRSTAFPSRRHATQHCLLAGHYWVAPTCQLTAAVSHFPSEFVELGVVLVQRAHQFSGALFQNNVPQRHLVFPAP